LVGSLVGNYRVLRRIGQGGMGVVYLAHHAVLGRRAAFKVLLPEFSNNQELVGRFFNEARATAQLRHRGFVEVFDSGHLPDGSAYLVMEYLSGANLGACIEHRRELPLPESLRILRDVAAAVQFAHAHRIVHRDLKPDNIYIATERDDGGDDEGVTVKVLDFGIAKLSTGAGDGHNSARTRTGLLLGTPLFMSPEQCRGAGSVDHRSDIYSLGCIAYNMLTGVPPFSFEGFGEIIAAHLSTPASPLRALAPSLPEPIERLVLSMLAKAPGDRPQTMALICSTIDELRRVLPEAQNGKGLLSLVPPRSAPEPELGPLPDPRSTSRPEVRPAPRTAPRAGSSVSTPAPAVNATPAPAMASTGSRRAGSVDQVASTVTTLRGGAGAVEDGDEALVAPGWSRNKKLAVGGGAAGAVVLIGVLLLHGSGDRAPTAAAAEGARPASSAPAAAPAAEPHPAAAAAPAQAPAAAPPPPAAPAPAAHPAAAQAAPAAPATVIVSITSSPAGAGIVEAASGKQLGVTPFSGPLPRATGGLRLALHKKGYRTKEVSVDVDHDSQTAVTLDKKPDEKRPNDDRRKL
jgi:serine/threonine-protein kinase